MSSETNTSSMLGKRAKAYDDDDKDDNNTTTKRPRKDTGGPQYWSDVLRPALQRAVRDRDIRRLTELLVEDSAKFSEYLSDVVPQSYELMQEINSMFMHIFDIDSDDLAHWNDMLSTDAMLPWKHLAQKMLMNGWFRLRNEDLHDKVVVVAMFADSPAYHEWMAKQIVALDPKEVFANPVHTNLADMGLVEWAYRSNNIPLLEWCHKLRSARDRRVFRRDDWKLNRFEEDSLNAASQATRTWWKANILSTLPQEQAAEEEQAMVSTDNV